MYDELGRWYSMVETIHEAYSFEDFDEYDCVCPVISQVLKWLREEKNIYVSIFIDDDSDCPVTYEIYKGTECMHTHHGEYFTLKDWNKCELRAIDYVLNNLIS